MTRISWKPGTMIYPLPAVMVTCGVKPEEYNIITISWTGTICSDPPMCYISVRPERHSYNLIKDSGCYVINLTTKKIAGATDWCGIKSGRDFDKFSEMGLTSLPAKHVNAPIIAESPVNIECRVKDLIELGSHHMFISEVVGIQAEKDLLEEKSGAFRLDKSEIICYSHGKYFITGEFIGKFGFSVEKRVSKGRKKSNGKKR